MRASPTRPSRNLTLNRTRGSNETNDSGNGTTDGGSNASGLAIQEESGEASAIGAAKGRGSFERSSLSYCHEEGEVSAAVEAAEEDAIVESSEHQSVVDNVDTLCLPPQPPPSFVSAGYIVACHIELHHGAALLRGSRRHPPPSSPRPAQALSSSNSMSAFLQLGTRSTKQQEAEMDQRQGSAACASSTWLRLTNNSASVGTAWYRTPLHLSSGFATTFTFQYTQPTKQFDRSINRYANEGGIAFVAQSDPRRTFAFGCPRGGLGVRADPNPLENCYQRISHGFAVLFLAEEALIIRTDEDFTTPHLAAVYPHPLRLDDGHAHHARLSYTPRAGGSLSLHIDSADLPLLTVNPLDLHTAALDVDGLALVGFTASGGDEGSEVHVEVYDWHLTVAEFAATDTA